MNEKPKNVEYSRPLESAKEAKQEMTDVDQMMGETRQYIEELKGDKEDALKDNEFAREHGFTETDIAKIDEYVLDAERSLEALQDIKTNFTELAARAEEAHAKGKALLEKHHSDRVN